MKQQLTVGVIGGGSWATAIVKLLQNNTEKINWYMRNKNAIEYIQKYQRNPNYITTAELDVSRISLSDDINKVVEKSDVLVFAVPAPFLISVLNKLDVSLESKFIVSAIKGIVPEENQIVGEFFHSKYSIPYNSIGIISGPCHAEEIAMERLSYLTIASPDTDNAQNFAELLECRYLKTKVSDDIFGTEYSAVLKNIFAIASGICHGLGYGDNFQAVLISNSIQEIKRFVDTVHPITRDIKSSAYLGDLLVTAYSQFSRNRTFGTMIGKGYSVKSAQVEMRMIAEGYYATNCIHQINENYKINMPITDAVYNMLYENIAPSIEIQLLTELIR